MPVYSPKLVQAAKAAAKKYLPSWMINWMPETPDPSDFIGLTGAAGAVIQAPKGVKLFHGTGDIVPIVNKGLQKIRPNYGNPYYLPDLFHSSERLGLAQEYARHRFSYGPTKAGVVELELPNIKRGLDVNEITPASDAEEIWKYMRKFKNYDDIGYWNKNGPREGDLSWMGDTEIHELDKLFRQNTGHGLIGDMDEGALFDAVKYWHGGAPAWAAPGNMYQIKRFLEPNIEYPIDVSRFKYIHNR